jgi:hypothetical protein
LRHMGLEGVAEADVHPIAEAGAGAEVAVERAHRPRFRSRRLRHGLIKPGVFMTLAGLWELASVMNTSRSREGTPLVPGWEWFSQERFAHIANYGGKGSASHRARVDRRVIQRCDQRPCVAIGHDVAPTSHRLATGAVIGTGLRQQSRGRGGLDGY